MPTLYFFLSTKYTLALVYGCVYVGRCVCESVGVVAVHVDVDVRVGVGGGEGVRVRVTDGVRDGVGVGDGVVVLGWEMNKQKGKTVIRA